MKLEIKIKLFDGQMMPVTISKGDWVDLRCNQDVDIKSPIALSLKRKTKNKEIIERYRHVSFSNTLIPLGVAMQLPKGFEAHILPRSGTFKNYGVLLANSQGIIDNSYCGDEDEWKFNAIALRDTQIKKGERICQFRIELSQKATVWQKLKWLFTSSIEFVQVDSLNNENRGGFSSTGIW